MLSSGNRGGDPPLALLLLVSALSLAIMLAMLTSRFAASAREAAGTVMSPARAPRHASAFHRMSPRRALRRKEWVLLSRDPWLLSQTLMQLLYLLPQAVLLP